MANNPWLNSDDIVSTVKRRIMLPLSEVTFSDSDILSFANQEMMGSQVPSMLQYHEEYLIYSESVAIVPNQASYPIPPRAIGMKLRYLFFQDSNGNMYDMTRINPNDKGYFMNVSQVTNTPYRYYIENNAIVLSLTELNNPSGFLVLGFFMRPNQLTTTDQAATITGFQNTITVDNTGLNAGDTVTIGNVVFTAVNSNASVKQFNIGGTSTTTTTNLVNAINNDATYSASNGNPAVNQATVQFLTVGTTIGTSNTASFVIPSTLTVLCDQVPSTFVGGQYYDVLQTNPGHKIIDYDILLGSSAFTQNSITFPGGSIDSSTLVGDYICLANQCIIPMIPPELHNILVERTCARVLSALGDTESLQNVNTKIQEMELRQGNMIDNRVEGNAQKVLNRNSILHFGKNFRRTIF